MNQEWISLKDIPVEGMEIVISDQSVWQALITEFKLPYALEKDFGATVRLIPQDGGCLIHGRIHGTVMVSCDRCAGSARVVMDLDFDAFLTLDEELKEEINADSIRMGQDGVIEIELATTLWEEFVVALPVKPLCKDDCKGLCSHCGKDLNKEECDCETELLDPRFAALRNLKVNN